MEGELTWEGAPFLKNKTKAPKGEKSLVHIPFSLAWTGECLEQQKQPSWLWDEKLEAKNHRAEHRGVEREQSPWWHHCVAELVPTITYLRACFMRNLIGYLLKPEVGFFYLQKYELPACSWFYFSNTLVWSVSGHYLVWHCALTFMNLWSNPLLLFNFFLWS